MMKNANNTPMTPEQLDRVIKEWSRIAQEPVRVEKVGYSLYAFGSELACLRLYKAFRGGARVDYSSNLTSWYFSPDHF